MVAQSKSITTMDTKYHEGIPIRFSFVKLYVLRGFPAFYFHSQTRRFTAYTTESTANEIASNTNAVAFAPE
jgi:hypothetical protein